MKKHLYLVCGGALAGLTLLHCSTLAETAKPKLDCRCSCFLARTTQNKRTKFEDGCGALRG